MAALSDTKTPAPDAREEPVQRKRDVALSIPIGQINAWNRLQIAARVEHTVEASRPPVRTLMWTSTAARIRQAHFDVRRFG